MLAAALEKSDEATDRIVLDELVQRAAYDKAMDARRTRTAREEQEELDGVERTPSA